MPSLRASPLGQINPPPYSVLGPPPDPCTTYTYINICTWYTMPDEVDSNGGEVSDAMSENEHEYDDNDASLKDDDKMPDNSSKQEPGPDGEVKKKYDPKDPLRPRRKKARRACFACQRAHLTCGMKCSSNATHYALTPSLA